MRYATALLALTLAIGCSAPSPPGETPATDPDIALDSGPEPVPPTTGFVEVPGARLFYEEAGTGLPVVLIHGGMLDRRMWDGQFQVLARRFRVVRFDARGHGKSTADPSVHQPHADLSAVLDHLKIDSAILIGHSMGARVAIDFTLENPGRVQALVVIAPGLSGYTSSELETNENYGLWAKAMREKNYDLAIEYFQRLYTDGPLRSPFEVDPDTRAKVREMALAVFSSEQHPGRAQSVEPAASGRLSEIVAPTLVIHGDLDTPDTRKIAELLEQQIAGATRVVIPGTAHMVNMEQSEEFNAELLQFLGQTFP